MAPKKKNGFYYFMLEIQRRESEKGVACTLVAAQKLADPEWKLLSPEQKQRYNDMAKYQNGIDKNDLSKKFTSLGVSFATIENQQRELTESLNIMSSNISRTVNDLHKKNKLASHPFFLTHVNFYYRTEDNYYAPAEFALVVFSFERGIIDRLHLFIDVGKIPLGYKYHVLEWSEKTHKIPLYDPAWNYALKDYYDIYMRVTSFIKKHSQTTEIPPIYTMVDSLSQNYSHSAVECAFENLCKAANLDTSMFRIYHLDRLFHEVLVTCRETNIISVALARSELEKDAFSYAQNLACQYHEEIDATVNCSLSMVVRWIFTICDHCCKFMGIDLILGFHVPLDVDVNWKTKQQGVAIYKDPRDLASRSLKFSNESQSAPSSSHTSAKNSQVSEDRDQRYRSTSDYRFDSVSSQSEVDSSDLGDADSDWTTVSGMGRGRGILSKPKKTQMLPTSGRGRLASLQ